ncbi:PIN domain-containing protein [uncultured Methanobacterium sp.]|uniref:PIN domain-containing protein n=1 Tax=uncultured Methanobacterium sp. TaxID=176306 RepID=UPI002AA87CB7|nr:PIN domain-containing protein [uncultured Methanobacterium sp.]
MSKTLDILSIVHLVDVNRDIALESGRIYADLIKKGKEIELNDCIIAASSLSVGIEKIITRNKEHFNRIDGIVAFEPEEIGF